MINIIDFDHNGNGIGRLNNKIIFVKNALPGEIVKIKIIEEKKNYIYAEVSSYIKKSNKRVSVKCPYYNKCGGCSCMHLSYDDQLLFKENKIKNIIKKYLHKDIKIDSIIAYDKQFNYRNKVSLKVKNNKLGFYEEKTHNIIEIEECLLLDNDINNLIKRLKSINLNDIDEITIRKGIDSLMLILNTKKNNIDIETIKPFVSSIYFKNDNKYNLIYGDKYIYEKIGDYRFAILPDAFFQVNNDICLKLYTKIKELIKEDKNVLDLYCGTGTIGIFVSKDKNVLGIEINKQAITCANKNKDINSISNINFILGDSSTSIKRYNFTPDVIILDPPRSGLNKNTVNEVLKYASSKIIYVSCNPLTLIRDLNLLQEKYDICKIIPFDMFPNTSHCESICLLESKKII